MHVSGEADIERRNGINMHDNYIVGYSVNIKEKELTIQTVQSLDDINGRGESIYFSEVLTHSFECILQCNIVFDIDECDIDTFISDHQTELEEMQVYDWPIDYDDLEELKKYLISNEYKYIRLNSSYGMSGWILTKSYCIKHSECQQ